MGISSSSTNIISEKLTEDCDKVDKWMIENKLKLNTDKTHLMVAGTDKMRRNVLGKHIY